MCQDGNDGMKTKPCWVINLLWPLRDQGRVEPEVQKEWQQIDIAWPHTGLEQACMSQGGRSCAMQFAIQAAKKHFDDKAYRIARSCQLHNQGALTSLGEAGVWKIAEWLRAL